jgi:hypothetical protein
MGVLATPKLGINSSARKLRSCARCLAQGRCSSADDQRALNGTNYAGSDSRITRGMHKTYTNKTAGRSALLPDWPASARNTCNTAAQRATAVAASTRFLLRGRRSDRGAAADESEGRDRSHAAMLLLSPSQMAAAHTPRLAASTSHGAPALGVCRCCRRCCRRCCCRRFCGVSPSAHQLTL